ncbi:dihydrolipoamide acetyltransferase family protein [Chloroflexota bacterium]
MIKMTMPKLGLTMTEGTIIEWRKKEGERVEKGEVLLVIETEKVSFEVEAQAPGLVGRIVANEGDVVPVGGVIAYLLEAEEELAAITQLISEQESGVSMEAEIEVATTRDAGAPSEVRASPLAKKLAGDHNIDISTVKGTGPGGRIIKEDILRAIEESKAAAVHLPHEEVKPLTTMRKIIAQRMTESFQAPHFYLTIEVDVGELIKVREELIPVVEAEVGVRLTYTDMIIRMVARVLEDNPALNCSYVDGSVRLFKRIDIGLVTAVEGGLLVPVIRQANMKTLAEIAVIRAELAQKAQERKITKEEMTDSTFTISNLGMFGIDQFSALLQPPEAAVLAVGRMTDRPIVREGQIVIRPVMNLTLSIDHRVLDGVVGSSFLKSLKDYIEKPTLVL